MQSQNVMNISKCMQDMHCNYNAILMHCPESDIRQMCVPFAKLNFESQRGVSLIRSSIIPLYSKMDRERARNNADEHSFIPTEVKLLCIVKNTMFSINYKDCKLLCSLWSLIGCYLFINELQGELEIFTEKFCRISLINCHFVKCMALKIVAYVIFSISLAD